MSLESRSMISNPGLYIAVCGLLFVLGAAVGRFLNRCVLRLSQHFYVIPAWKHVFEKESRRGIYPATRWYHALPVIGTACLVGRSPYSGRRILAREPWLELLNGGLFVMTLLCTIPPVGWGGLEAVRVASPLWAGNLFGWPEVSPLFLWSRYLYFLVLVEALFVATFIDFDLWIIPDGVTVPAMIFGAIGQCLGIGFFLTPVWVQDPELVQLGAQFIPLLEYWPQSRWIPAWIFAQPLAHAAAVAGAGFIVGGAIVWAVRIIGGVVLRREAMGFGDVILMAMMGTFLGWQPMVVIFFLAPLLALVVLVLISLLRFFSLVRIPPELPYGPYLSLAALITLFNWNVLWPAFERIFLLGPLLFILGGMMLVLLAGTLFLLQGLKRLLGIAQWEEETAAWGPADQLMYLSGENQDSRQGNWSRTGWSGNAAGQGRVHELRWRNRCP